MELYISESSKGFTQEEFDEIKLCLETLLSVRAGSQPLDRDLGIDYEQIVGYPMDVAKNMIALEIIEKIEKYEKRVAVEAVDFEVGEEDGELLPKIYIRKAEG